MDLIDAPLSDSELEQLADFLDALPSPEAMNIERLDGFFCALIVGPDLVMPSEYWPYVIGDTSDEGTPAFDLLEQAQGIMGLLARHWNNIVGTLLDGDVYLPLILGDENGVPLGNDWAKGFMDGVAIRVSSWQTFLKDDDHADAIIPMLALAHEHDPAPAQPFESLLQEKREEILQLMAIGVTEIYRYFAPARARPAPATQPFVRDLAKIGRNEPCPCGSGKKYKHCCMTRLQ